VSGIGILKDKPMNKGTSKSPLKAPLLRLAGQSIDEQMKHILNEKQVNYALFAFGFFLLAGTAWIQVFTDCRLNPWIFSAVAILGIGYCRAPLSGPNFRRQWHAETILLGYWKG